MQKRQALLAAVFVALLCLSKADLPIHCIQAQVEGTWKVEFSSSKIVKSIEEVRCGYSSPSTVFDALRNVPNDSFKTSKTINIKLDKYN